MGSLTAVSDILLVETIFDTLNAKAAVFAILGLFEERSSSVPVMISGTIADASGRTLSGQTTEAFYNSIRHAEPFSVGLNCALGAEQLRPYLEELSQIADVPVSCHPNAGLPNAFGEYDETPDITSRIIREFAEAGFVNIVGGCCGTVPAHIEAIADAVAGLPPRTLPKHEPRFRVSGLEALTIGPDSLFAEHRRAHQRHRLEAFSGSHHGRCLRARGRGCPGSRWRAAHRCSISTWMRACSTPSRQ